MRASHRFVSRSGIAFRPTQLHQILFDTTFGEQEFGHVGRAYPKAPRGLSHVGNCPVPTIIEVDVLKVVAIVYLALTYLTFISQE